MGTAEHNTRKTELLRQIQQQRLDIKIAKHDWLKVTAPYDRSWQTVVSLRRYFMLAGGILAIWNVRRPRKIALLVKRGFSIWSTWRVIRTSLNKMLVKS